MDVLVSSSILAAIGGNLAADGGDPPRKCC
jgi:hypothetical protein